MADRRPRVLLATGPVGDLAPRAVAVALARGFADAADVAVIGLAEGGAALGRALAGPDGEFESLSTGWLAHGAGLVAVGGVASQPSDDPLAGSSSALGRLAGYAASRTPTGTLVVDLTGSAPACHDAGAGLLGALGAVADVPLDAGPDALARLTELDLHPVRELLADRPLVGVVPPGEVTDLLLGLRGITSRRGRAALVAAPRMLAVDDALERFARAAAPELAAAPGAGAAGGLGFAVLALGGRLATGAALAAEVWGLPRALAGADLVVTACDSFDFGSRGGGVVTELARRCDEAETPLVVVASALGMSGREMRVMGVESAHPIEPASDLEPALTETGRRLAAGWLARW